jgi:hypothetical protein
MNIRREKEIIFSMSKEISGGYLLGKFLRNGKKIIQIRSLLRRSIKEALLWSGKYNSSTAAKQTASGTLKAPKY